jgi:ABC-type sugar transport system ATPase subunit
VIVFSHITKTFAGVVALSNVSCTIARGECHGWMGENGAGKSTLGKILAGIHRADSGQMTVDGKVYDPHSPRDAASAGIGMVHQELAFCPDLSIAENLCMGQYPTRMRLLLDRRGMVHRAKDLLAQIGVTMLDVTRPMRSLSTAQEQLVQIASAVGTGAGILIFDEPTSSLSETEAQNLFALIDRLKSRGVTIIYVSHRMPEVFRLCDRISILRDGRYVATVDRSRATPQELVKMMIGRTIEEFSPQHLQHKPADVLLRVSHLASPGVFDDICFEVRANEIVGFAGLVGAGRSEVARAIFGLDKHATGVIELRDKRLPIGSTRAAMRAGIGLVPEDRKRQGLVLMMGSRQNFSLAMLERFQRLGLINFGAEYRAANDYLSRLHVRSSSIDAPVASLSGGNQQKVALAKWLGRDAKVLIFDEPTRGVDVGAKAAIHRTIDDLARQGVGIMLISSELPELLNLSTRILVMRQGRLIAEVPGSQATQEHVLRLMAGVAASEESTRIA